MSDSLPPGDHRVLGRTLDLFHVQEDAAGSVFWHTRGHTLYRTIENYIREKLESAGYGEVKTPQLFDKSLFEASGHWEHYRDNMFLTGDLDQLPPTRIGEAMVVEGDDIVYPMRAFKAMNCPGHVQIFNAKTVSYRQLPWRMAEFGCCHRNEPSGSLQGIMRVRQFTQDDAHIFCTEDQVMSETKAFCELLLGVYKDFGFENIEIGLSTRPEGRAGTDEVWDQAEKALEDAVKAIGLDYKVQPGEGAFYGPKLEFALTDSKGRKWQCGTIQMDFILPVRLDAFYVAPDGTQKHPIMLHRAILGSMERFIGILLEHYEGHLPSWLAPEQVVVMTIKPEADDYARGVYQAFVDAGVRTSLDLRDDHVSQKIKDHSLMLTPYIVAVGPRDMEAKTVAIRKFGETKPITATIGGAIGTIAHDVRQPDLVD